MLAEQKVILKLSTILRIDFKDNIQPAPAVQDLVDWLDQNNYTYPEGAEAILEDYILRSWFFLAVRIKPANPGILIKQSLMPIQINFETGEPVFPLMISSLSSEPETEILIHFLSDHRYRTSNVSSEEVYYTYSEEPSDYKSEYQQWMKAQILWEGFENHGGAQSYLKKIIEVTNDKDTTIRRWAISLSEEIDNVIKKTEK
jgi:hypothetical protein